MRKHVRKGETHRSAAGEDALAAQQPIRSSPPEGLTTQIPNGHINGVRPSIHNSVVKEVRRNSAIRSHLSASISCLCRSALRNASHQPRTTVACDLFLVDPVVLLLLPGVEIAVLEPQLDLLVSGVNAIRTVANVAADILDILR